jgi:hypothetical protein
MTAAALRHVYVATAVLIALVALIAAAFNGRSITGSQQSVAPKGERAVQYIGLPPWAKRATTATSSRSDRASPP